MLTSSLLAPHVPCKVRLKCAIVVLSAQRTVRLNSQRNASRWRLTQSAFLIAVTENKSVESHVGVVIPNAMVSDGSQPPKTLNLFLSESAGSRSLDRLVRLVACRKAR